MRFSLAELIMLVAAEAFAMRAIAIPTQADRAVATVAAVMLGLTITGPPLLWWRRRTGVLVGQWGVGELAWFGVGLYLLPFTLWSIVNPLNRVTAQNWLILGFVLGGALALSTLIVGGVRWLSEPLGGRPISDRQWFVRRSTNLMGIIIVLLYAGGVGLALLLGA